MVQWNAAQYLRFKKERTQPAIDLAARVTGLTVHKALDVGCGPGNSTRVVKERFPGADVLGIDFAEDMLRTAREQHPDLRFAACDVSKDLPSLDNDYDLVFSNACLQWVPDHAALIPKLLGRLKPGGVLAAQIPMNMEEPIHQIIEGLVKSDAWAGYFPNPRVFYTLSPEGYYDLLAAHAKTFAIWQTTYIHVLPSVEAILEWYRGTGLKPYLEALPGDRVGVFEAAVMAEVERAYPAQRDGAVLFRFPRFFFLAERGE